MTWALESLQRMERMIWPMLTRATVPYGLPQAPRIPVWSLKAKASAGILSMTTRCTPISSSTGQHLIDPQDVEGVDTDTQMERIFSRRLDDILVGTNTSSFQGFRRKLFILVRNEMATEREFVNRGTFASQIKDTDLSRWGET